MGAMKQSELERVLAGVEREVARQNAELREAIGDDEPELLAQWRATIEFRPVARAPGAPRAWMGAVRA
jgi:hypothetical protein